MDSELARRSKPSWALMQAEVDERCVLQNRQFHRVHSTCTGLHDSTVTAPRPCQKLCVHGSRVAARAASYKDTASTRRRLRARRVKSTRARGANSCAGCERRFQGRAVTLATAFPASGRASTRVGHADCAYIDGPDPPARVYSPIIHCTRASAIRSDLGLGVNLGRTEV